MSPDWTQPLLTALRQLGKVAPAARAVGISAAAVYARRKDDADFDAACDDAISECVDDMEAEMVRRGKDGLNEPVIYQGQMQYVTEYVLDEEGNIKHDGKGNALTRPVRDANGDFVPLTVNKRSDALLMFGLKGYRKGVFADRTELTGANGKDLNEQMTDVKRTSRVAALLELARRRKEDDIG